MWINKNSKLKISYHRSFLALIVIPILLVILVAMGVINIMARDGAIQNIQRMQDNIVSTLNSEIRDGSLRLSHFVYVNDNEIMGLAAKTNTEDKQKRYTYTRQLTEFFNLVMIPVQDVMSTMFYMKDGDFVYLKDNLRETPEDIKTSDWYIKAIEHINVVKVGSYNQNITYANRTSHPFIIALGLSPGPDVDKEGRIEMVALFLSSEAGEMVRRYNKEPLLGTTCLLDQEGKLIFSLDEETGFKDHLLSWQQESAKGIISPKEKRGEYLYITSEIPSTGWKVVTMVKASVLTSGFYKIFTAIILVTSLLFLLFYRFSSYFLKNIIRPVNDMVEGLKQVEAGSLDVHIEPTGQSEIRTMIHSFNRMSRRLKILIHENEEGQQKKHEAEMKALQSQINPHFLVNSLSSIRFMAQVSKFEGIRKMAEALIKILSCSFRSNSGFYTVKDELEVLESYVYLMKIRYSDSFEIDCQADPGCLSFQVPRLILQPVVENSIIHGFRELLDDIGLIQLKVYQKDGYLYFHIRDNGMGMTEEQIKALLAGEKTEENDNTSIGVTNVNTRLILNYGKECGLKMESELGKYTATTIKIPVSAD